MNDIPDNLIKVYLDLPNHWWFKGESLWAKYLGNDLFEIQNIPYCAYGLNCGDVVLATADAPDLKPEVRKVVNQSGNQTLRVSFNISKEQQSPYINAIEATGAWIERANSEFICINVPPESNSQNCVNTLNSKKLLERLSTKLVKSAFPAPLTPLPKEAVAMSSNPSIKWDALKRAPYLMP